MEDHCGAIVRSAASLPHGPAPEGGHCTTSLAALPLSRRERIKGEGPYSARSSARASRFRSSPAAIAPRPLWKGKYTDRAFTARVL